MWSKFKDSTYPVRDIVDQFMEKPSKETNPNYSRVIKTHIDFETINNCISSNEYNMAEFCTDVNTMFENYKRSDAPESKLYKSACLLQKMFKKVKMIKLKGFLGLSKFHILLIALLGYFSNFQKYLAYAIFWSIPRLLQFFW